MDFRELVKVGAHYGHLRSRLNPKMSPYIWGMKNNVHLIDVSKTAYLVEKAAKFLEQVASKDKPILWIGTKKPSREAISSVAQKLGMPYVSNRWIGGTLSNYGQVKKSVTKLLHYEDIISKSEKFPYYTKKEINRFAKVVDKLKNNIGGIMGLTWPIGAIVIVDAVKELSALKEAATVGIPVVAIVDTNGDPTLVDYVIPANDDSSRSIKLIVDYLAQYVQKGKDAAQVAKKEKEAKVKAAPKVEEKKGVVEKKEKTVTKKTAGDTPRSASKAKSKASTTKEKEKAAEKKK